LKVARTLGEFGVQVIPHSPYFGQLPQSAASDVGQGRGPDRGVRMKRAHALWGANTPIDRQHQCRKVLVWPRT
jgi:hypothetical protein